MTKTYLKLTMAAVLACFLASCAYGPKKPDWIMKGSGAFKQDKNIFYGVGLAEGIKSEALRRTTADNRAIAVISQQLSTMSTSLMRDYMSAASVPAEAKSNEEQYVENVNKTFTNNMVSGVKIIDRWENPKTGTLYSLASLDLETLKSMTDQMQTLSNEVKEHIKANADKAFDVLAAEEAKQAK